MTAPQTSAPNPPTDQARPPLFILLPEPTHRGPQTRKNTILLTNCPTPTVPCLSLESVLGWLGLSEANPQLFDSGHSLRSTPATRRFGRDDALVPSAALPHQEAPKTEKRDPVDQLSHQQPTAHVPNKNRGRTAASSGRAAPLKTTLVLIRVLRTPASCSTPASGSDTARWPPPAAVPANRAR